MKMKKCDYCKFNSSNMYTLKKTDCAPDNVSRLKGNLIICDTCYYMGEYHNTCTYCERDFYGDSYDVSGYGIVCKFCHTHHINYCDGCNNGALTNALTKIDYGDYCDYCRDTLFIEMPQHYAAYAPINWMIDQLKEKGVRVS